MYYHTLEEIIEDAVKNLNETDIKILNERCSKAEDMIQFHHGYGTYIRNTYKLWDSNNPLTKEEHPDDVSHKILVGIFELLKSRGLLK